MKRRNELKAERMRRIICEISNGHLEPAISIVCGEEYVYGVKCAYCGKVYETRMANARRHLEHEHRITWRKTKENQGSAR